MPSGLPPTISASSPPMPAYAGPSTSYLPFAISSPLLFIAELPETLFSIDNPCDDELVWSHRRAAVVGHDVHKDSLPRSNRPRPLVFERAIGALIEIGVLSEVVEPFSWPIEAGCNEMSAMITRTAIRLAGIGLRAPRPWLLLQPYFTRNPARPSMRVN